MIDLCQASPESHDHNLHCLYQMLSYQKCSLQKLQMLLSLCVRNAPDHTLQSLLLLQSFAFPTMRVPCMQETQALDSLRPPVQLKIFLR